MTLLPPARRPSPSVAPTLTSPFLGDLARHGDAAALVVDGAVVTYESLAHRVDEAVEQLDRRGSRRLVVVEAGNAVAPLVTYLACLRAGHAAVLVPAAAPGATPAWRGILSAYDPDVVVARDREAPDGWSTTERRRGAGHDLHPDLALLLSTSGSTGAPKLVRLSHENLRANAASIASYLDLTPRDRAITSLPIGYCYGLSVVNSHLAVGASLVLSDRSVIDDGFWRELTRHGATSFAGVPHTFELLDRIGFADLHLPTLRYVTQAGGRLDPGTVRRYAELGRRRGWELYVMYGQTEATARMAYLPPSRAERSPAAIGIAVPGGDLRLDDIDADGVGELVYRGPNVMLGYAEAPHHLALGRTVEELRTGDLARIDADGLFEVVGRRARFVKPFGLRIDLDELERLLRADGVEALCAGDDRRVVVATTPADVQRATTALTARLALPPSALEVHGMTDLPRLPSGKPDHAAVLALAARTASPRPPAGSVRRLYADVLQRAEVCDDDTFVALGGDSLSYVELSVRLEEAIGALPDEWPALPVAELERRRPAADASGDVPPAPRTAAVETTVVLRAAAIVLIVATHTALVDLKGGAHLLLAVAGWNFARFQLPVVGRRLATSIGRVALPTMAWIAFLLFATDAYDVTNFALVHTQVGEAAWDERWRFWFIETLVQALALVGAVVAIPPLRRLERRFPFGFAAGAFGAALALREVAAQEGTVRRPQEVLWFFVLGWAIHRARTTPQKVLVTVACAAAVGGFFGQPLREALVVTGLTTLVWVRAVPIVRPLHRVVAAVASASLAIYLTHWHVYPAVRDASSPTIALLTSLAAGLAVHALAQRLTAAVRRS